MRMRSLKVLLIIAKKTDQGWDSSNGGFCENLDEIIDRVNKESGLPCVKGTAHLPKGYTPEILE